LCVVFRASDSSATAQTRSHTKRKSRTQLSFWSTFFRGRWNFLICRVPTQGLGSGSRQSDLLVFGQVLLSFSHGNRPQVKILAEGCTIISALDRCFFVG